MSSKRFTKRIEIWQLTPVTNGFGGNTVTDTLIASSWAEVKTFQAGRFRGGNLADFGILEGNNAILFKLRKRKDLTYDLKSIYIKYRGVKYTISSAPNNTDFNDREISFIGVAETNKSNVAG